MTPRVRPQSRVYIVSLHHRILGRGQAIHYHHRQQGAEAEAGRGKGMVSIVARDAYTRQPAPGITESPSRRRTWRLEGDSGM